MPASRFFFFASITKTRTRYRPKKQISGPGANGKVQKFQRNFCSDAKKAEAQSV